ncbi:RHS repeat domain-containing protein [Shewanella surugensis]|uniref:RHS repeat-associated core domain-containing protein n=1 Tax=Shewanella surugensis TaxID=212020 RepID=A0ABT0LG05_9GAMM|nr:RHS repeat-associated core domain-containing protein [Shewanella surugensis]MCL1126598.1 RHS repeat-associated core domain-containing protein [Shewanella surugensis]
MDANDNLTQLTDNIDSKNSIKNVQYDGLNRLKMANGRWGSGHYSYDSVNNIRSRSISGSNIKYEYDSKNRLGSVSGGYKYDYDSRGNTVNNGRYGLTYNLANQLVTANGQKYVYDGNGKRVKQTNANGVKYTIYSLGGKLLYRESQSGAGTISIYTGGQLIAESDGKNATYQHTDMLGSPVLETDSNGKVSTRSYYEPFGKRLGGDKEGIGFTGHLQDKDLGLTYMQARYYDPLIGRFYSNDPVSFVDTQFSFNRYSYANNNPYMFVDPDGKFNAYNATFGGISGGTAGFLNAGDSIADKVYATLIGASAGALAGSAFNDARLSAMSSNAIGQVAGAYVSAVRDKGFNNVNFESMSVDGTTISFGDIHIDLFAVAVNGASANILSNGNQVIANRTMKDVIGSRVGESVPALLSGQVGGAVVEGIGAATVEVLYNGYGPSVWKQMVQAYELVGPFEEKTDRAGRL